MSVRKAALALVGKMTLQEKASQLLCESPAIERLGLPACDWRCEAPDGIAGAGTATVFPRALGLAAAFDPPLARRVAEAVSTEARAKFHGTGLHRWLTIAGPSLNILRDPRWGGGQDTYGEDPYLVKRMAAAFIKGLQGDDDRHLKTAACPRRFAACSGPEYGGGFAGAETDEYDLWNTYLPAFEAAVREANVTGIQAAPTALNGEPCCGSKMLLQDILRGKWGFKGYVFAGGEGVRSLHERHRAADTAVEGAALAVRSGCDLDGDDLLRYAADAVKEGLLSELELDRAVARLLEVRLRLGLPDGSTQDERYVSVPYESADSPAHRSLNLEVARRGVVLLKNDGALPLNFASLKTLGVIGPFADNRAVLDASGRAASHTTPLQGLRELAGGSARILYALGCTPGGDGDAVLSAEAEAVAARSDAVVLCLGMEPDGGDRADIELPAAQRRLLERVVEAARGKPVIAAVLSAAPLALTAPDERCNAVLQAFCPGAEGGRAVAEVLCGAVCPEGRLPVTLYRTTGDLPDFKSYSMQNRTYRYFKGEPLYPFGFGLSYGQLALEGLSAGQEICLVSVRNTGALETRDTIQVYVENPGAREKFRLCGLEKVTLRSGDRTDVCVELDPNAFSRCKPDGNWEPIRGTHTLHVGFTQPDRRSFALTRHTPMQAKIVI